MITEEMFGGMVVKAKEEMREKQRQLIEQERERQQKLVRDTRTPDATDDCEQKKNGKGSCNSVAFIDLRSV